jgi:hypothetical protein
MQPTQPGMAPRGADATGMRTACAFDFQRLCRGVQPGGGRVVQCLLANRDALSPACGAALAALRPGGGMAAMPPPDALGPAPQRAGGPPPPGNGPPPPPGSAPPSPGNRAAFQASCGPDAKLFCAGVPRENQGIVKCLSSHGMELSVTCKAFFQEMRPERGAQRNLPNSSPPPPTAPPGVTPPSTKDAPPAAGAPPNQ